MSEKISVIIPTKNRTEDVIRCLESILIQTIVPDEIVIADSSDTEELRNELNAFSNLNIKYIPVEVGKKFKGSSNISRNRGIENSTGDIIFITDDDVIFCEKYVEAVLQVFDDDKEKKVGGVTVNLVNSCDDITETTARRKSKKEKRGNVRAFLGFIYQIFLTVFFLPLSGNGRIKIVEYLCGCCAFRKEVISTFKFDENLNLHGCCFGDDDDIGYRVSRRYQNVYTPFAKAIHKPSLVRSNRYAKNRLMILNHHYLFKKNLPQDITHTFAFWWSIVGLFIKEWITMVESGDSSGVRGLASGFINIIK
jgi:glycosyltransferase involved in cell wall biosynthesis